MVFKLLDILLRTRDSKEFLLFVPPDQLPTCKYLSWICKPLLSNVCYWIPFYRTQVSLGSDLWVCFSQTEWVREPPFWNLTEVTLADEDTNSILADNAKGQSKAMWQCMWRYLVAIFGINASGAIWWPNLQPMQGAIWWPKLELSVAIWWLNLQLK